MRMKIKRINRKSYKSSQILWKIIKYLNLRIKMDSFNFEIKIKLIIINLEVFHLKEGKDSEFKIVLKILINNNK
jgi:hypothetical protein